MAAPQVLWVNAGSNVAPAGVPAPCKAFFHAPADALNELKNKGFDAIVLQFPIPHWTPDQLLSEVRRRAPDTPVLVRNPEVPVSAFPPPGSVRVLPGRNDDAALILRAIEEHSHPPTAPWESLLVGTSLEMCRVREIIRLVGARRATVLITGETGTGKELAARALHLAGPRSHGPLVAVNCSALPENLLEAELFGHVRGAFTGALQNRIGRFEQARGGTLLLDEIGELPLDVQAKLLRVLQEREFQRLGSSETIRADVRVVAATNCDLTERIEQGRFREDLYYRLNVVPLPMPPLRQRAGDIPLLAEHFIEKVCLAEGISAKGFTAAAMERLCAISWPGNVRQLENAVEMAVALSGDRLELTAEDFPVQAPARLRLPQEMPLISVPDTGLDYEQTLAWIERSILEQALRKTGGNKKAAAAMLRLKRTTLSAKVRSLDMPAA